MPICARSGDSRPSAATASAAPICDRHLPASPRRRRHRPPAVVTAAGAISSRFAARSTAAYSAARICRFSAIWPSASAPTSCASKCSEKGEAGLPGCAIGDQDFADGLGVRLQLRPHAQRRQHAHAGIGQAPTPGRRNSGPAPRHGARHRPPTVFSPPCASARPRVRPTMPPPQIDDISAASWPHLQHAIAQKVVVKNCANIAFLHNISGKNVCLFLSHESAIFRQ